MSLVGIGKSLAARSFALLVVVALTLLSACTTIELPAHLKPLTPETKALLAKKKMSVKDPMFIRIFKEESELEIWKLKSDGHYYHFKTYPICNWSGALGPKFKQGDKQSPEGFYQVTQHRMNPNSSFHLSFNLGYPNAFDRAQNRTGNFLMVHGKCRSAGCYAMTDALMEEIYTLAREAFISGQDVIHVHAFPFRMTDDNMQRHQLSPHIRFWRTLKHGYDHFEMSRTVPEIAVCERRYVVNVAWPGGKRKRLRGNARCPRFERPQIRVFIPPGGASEPKNRDIAPGIKTRAAASQPGMPSVYWGATKVPNQTAVVGRVLSGQPQ